MTPTPKNDEPRKCEQCKTERAQWMCLECSEYCCLACLEIHGHD